MMSRKRINNIRMISSQNANKYRDQVHNINMSTTGLFLNNNLLMIQRDNKTHGMWVNQHMDQDYLVQPHPSSFMLLHPYHLKLLVLFLLLNTNSQLILIFIILSNNLTPNSTNIQIFLLHFLILYIHLTLKELFIVCKAHLLML